ncbi:acyl-CoA thioester hydrolase [Clostridium sp. AWRP]|nr:acyl-CoA thioester hydrolase [Clostridium sp. AWRP]
MIEGRGEFMNNDNCTIKITPEVSRADESVDIEINGLSKNEKVTIRAVSSDYYCINTSILEIGDNTLWESYAVFETDECGNIDLKNAVPVDGTYSNCDKMGLFYSMRPRQIRKSKLIQKLSNINENRKYKITFTVEKNGKIIASKEHTKVYCDDTIESIDIVEKNLLARYFTYKDNIKHPAIIVLSGSDGRIEKAQAIAELFAMRGYSALAVCYFGLEGIPEDLNMIPLEYVENAVKWLKRQDTVDENKIAIYGRSKGGELVLLAASMFKDITCVIANTPSCYVYEGIKNGKLPSHHSSWMYRGREIPYLKFSFHIILRLIIKMMKKEKGALAWMYKKLIEEGDRDKATIALDKINGSVLMISSAADEIWPSKMHSETACSIFEKSHFKHEYKHITFAKSGHMLTVPFQSIYPSEKYPYDVESWAQANMDSWNETVKFLEKWASK